MTGKMFTCTECCDWYTDQGFRITDASKNNYNTREAHLQSLKTPKCEVNGCGCEASRDSIQFNLSAKLCNNHLKEYEEDDKSYPASQFVNMKNATKTCQYPSCKDCADPETVDLSGALCSQHYTQWKSETRDNIEVWLETKKQPIELLIQPLGSRVKVQGNGIKWSWINSEDLTTEDYETGYTDPEKLFVEPNAQGILKVTHTTPKGDFVQEFCFGKYQYRTDTLKSDWSRYENYNDPISEFFTDRLKPIELSNDADQLQRLGESLGKAAESMVATGQMLGVAMKSARAGEMVSFPLIPPRSFTNFNSNPVTVNLTFPDTSKGFPRINTETLKRAAEAIRNQPEEGLLTTEKLPLDNCDDSPNTYEVTETTVTNDTEKKTMNTKELYTAPVLKEDLSDAGIRLAGRQFTKATRDVVAAAIAGHAAPGDDTLRAKVADFLKTDLGEALLQSFLSIGLSSLPESTGAIPALLARELRVSSMTGAGDVFADLLMGPLRQVTSTLIQGMPKPPTAALEVQSQNVVKVNVPVGVEAEVNR